MLTAALTFAPVLACYEQYRLALEPSDFLGTTVFDHSSNVGILGFGAFSVALFLGVWIVRTAAHAYVARRMAAARLR